MSDFLLELLSEEIPARMQDKARADLARLFAEQLAEAGMEASEIVTYATPRRLALIARGLPAVTASVIEDIKGPPADAPDAAIDGFLRKLGLTRDVLQTRDLKGRLTLFAVISRQGRPTGAVLAEAIPAIIRAFPWPKSMRWGEASISTESQRWVRPLHNIVAIFGEEVVAFEAAGVTSGATTYGHRFHHPGPITIGGARDYVEKMRACHVIVDQEERKAIIRKESDKLQRKTKTIPDEGLVAENAGLTEWPVPLKGSFDAAFLALPPELIRLTMRVNQKYFACQDGEGTLSNRFVCVANIDSSDPDAVVAGNEKVLAARLSDAKFFWDQDVKVPLAEQAKKLDQIVFHEKLGTTAEKVERVAKLAQWLVNERLVKGADPLETLTAGRLAKADLVSELVGEFPELQGVIGGYYARAQGLPAAVAKAIGDHYKPAGQGDEVPTDPVTVAVNIADRLDSLVAFFSIGEKPTGSRDPFALRRAGLGFLQLLTKNRLRLPLSDVLVQAAVLNIVSRLGAISSVTFPDLLESDDHEHEITAEVGTYTYRHGDRVVVRWKSELTPNIERGKIIEEATDLSEAILEFLEDRLKVQQKEAGVRHDLIDAVFALGGEDDLVRLLARVAALQHFVESPQGADLLAGYKRAANILKKEGWEHKEPVRPDRSLAPQYVDGVRVSGTGYAPQIEETELDDALDAAEPKVKAALADEEYERAMAALASLRGPVDAFFEKVTVNDPDPATREVRLSLLARVRDAVHKVADFSRIEG
ncbi:glycine--tRNA ligase subunit beta [Allosphingosinicella sp.]|uniref:glycine--tRNA ligase subunit beta n=1 Tax=Allosphingosinicella sp. TaxID=2823234 RepID=UPI003783AC02